jgi:undecaprenyl-phosphate galactose phosphotransferase
MLGQVVSLAREARQTETGAETLRSFPALTDILRVSGRWLLASDIIALIAAYSCGGISAWALDMYALQGSFQDLFALDTLRQFAIFSGLGLMALLWLDMKGHYRQRLPYWETIGHILSVALVGFLVGGFVQFAQKGGFSRLWLGLSWSMFAVFLLIGRSYVRKRLERKGQWQIPALLIGNGPTAQAALHALEREPQMGFTIVDQIAPKVLNDLARPRAWKRLMLAHGARHVFLALEGSELEKQQAAMKAMVRERMPCSIIPPWLGLPTSTLSPHHFMMHDVLLLHDTNRLMLPLPGFLKRGFDIALAGAGLLVLMPVFAVVAFIIRRDGGPAFFTQQRVGKDGKTFACYKFRSMRIDAEELLQKHLAGNPESAAEWQKFQKLKQDVRVTKCGEFIRRTSIDELPQLFNVLKGDMSLVGPRPIMPGQEHYYDDDFVFYESVRPGITGPWQVSGRNQLTFKERVALESWYARNWSLWMDVVIILKTLPALLKKDQAF